MTIRAFIGITCPAELQQSVNEIQRALGVHANAWRWVRPENLHLTLRFLGNINHGQGHALAEGMTFAVRGQPVFPLWAQDLGCFPNPGRPRVLWMDLYDPEFVLHLIYEQLTRALAQLGLSQDDKPFRPHLTLARARHNVDQKAFQTLLDTYQGHQFGIITVKQIHLFQSQLYRGGAVYTILRSIEFLRGTAPFRWQGDRSQSRKA